MSVDQKQHPLQNQRVLAQSPFGLGEVFAGTLTGTKPILDEEGQETGTRFFVDAVGEDGIPQTRTATAVWQP